MLKVRQAVIVEGKYDKIKLDSILDALIIETDGFAIFKDREKLTMIQALAKKTGIVILTDSDAAGFKIRRYIMSAVDKNCITHVYIPDLFGTEKRKAHPSAEGKLGVEGIPKTTILDAFEKAGIALTDQPEKTARDPVTKSDLFMLGLTGTPDCTDRRNRLLKFLDLPQRLTTNSMLAVINTLYTPEEFGELLGKLALTAG